jgi:hypothetical protein
MTGMSTEPGPFMGRRGCITGNFLKTSPYFTQGTISGGITLKVGKCGNLCY